MWDLLISPLVGAVGGIVTQVISYKTHALDLEDKNRDREHERSMAAIRHSQSVEITKLEQSGVERKIAIEGDIAAVQSDLANLGKALESVPKWSGVQDGDNVWIRWWKTIVESLQMLVRVAVTLWLTYKLSGLSDRAMVSLEAYPVAFSQTDAASIYMLVMRGVVELTLLAVGFWFGSRGAQLVQQKSVAPK